MLSCLCSFYVVARSSAANSHRMCSLEIQNVFFRIFMYRGSIDRHGCGGHERICHGGSSEPFADGQ